MIRKKIKIVLIKDGDGVVCRRRAATLGVVISLNVCFQFLTSSNSFAVGPALIRLDGMHRKVDGCGDVRKFRKGVDYLSDRFGFRGGDSNVRNYRFTGGARQRRV